MADSSGPASRLEMSDLMNLNVGMPVLAAGIQELLGVVLVIIWVIGWLIRTVQANSQQLPAPVNRPGRRREERVEDEIDSFLQQVNRNAPNRSNVPESESARPAKPPRNPPRPKPHGSTPTPVISQRPRQAMAHQASAPPQGAAAASAAALQSKPPSGNRRDGKAVNQRQPAPNIGQGVAEHLQQYMAERVAKTSQEDVGRGVKESVQSHLGVYTGSAGTPNLTSGAGDFGSPPSATTGNCRPVVSGTARAAEVRCCLLSPQSVRQAIIVQEILKRRKPGR